MADAATINVRPARVEDVPVLCAFLNEIIRIGGTTAHETPFTHESFASHFLAGPGLVSCFVAEDGSDEPCAFQALERWDGLPEGWVDIGTFARLMRKFPAPAPRFSPPRRRMPVTPASWRSTPRSVPTISAVWPTTARWASSTTRSTRRCR